MLPAQSVALPRWHPLWREALPHLAELRSAARRFAGSRRDVADDLLQETMLRAFAAADGYRPGTNARAWLYAILTNTARSAFRRERREQRLQERYASEPSIPREAPAPASVPKRASAKGPGLHDLVGELPPDFRAVVELVDLQGQSYKQVAERLAIPVGTVMSRLHRARRRLRRRLDAGCEPPER